MVNPNAGLAFIQGFRNARDDVRQQRQADEQSALQKSELAHAQSRRAITEGQQDTQYQQGQQDRAQQQSDLQAANLAKGEAIRKQAQQEGLGHFFDFVEAGGDPAEGAKAFNSSGELTFDVAADPATGVLTMQGPRGAKVSGTVAQLRARFGLENEQKPIALSDGGMLVTPKGKVLAENPKAGAAKNEFKEFDPKKDVYKINADGTRTLVSRGVKDETAGESGQKLSTYNPQSHQDQAIKVANDAFRKKKDEQGDFVFENPEDSERQAYAADLIGGWMSQKGVDAQGYGAGELGNLAFKSSKQRMTAKEAGDAAVKAGNVVGSPGYNREVARLIRDSDVKAAQVWNEGIDAIEAKRKAKENKSNGGKPPLSSFQR